MKAQRPWGGAHGGTQGTGGLETVQEGPWGPPLATSPPSIGHDSARIQRQRGKHGVGSGIWGGPPWGPHPTQQQDGASGGVTINQEPRGCTPLPLGAPLPALLELPHSCRPPRVQGTGGWGHSGL